MSDKHKHLELLSAVIGRMAQNSFTTRGWSITVATAIVAFGVEAQSPGTVLAAIIPLLVFWASDAFYLRQERAFRRKFDIVRTTSEEEIDFDMSPVFKESLVRVMFHSSVYALLYFGLALAIIAITISIYI